MTGQPNQSGSDQHQARPPLLPAHSLTLAELELLLQQRVVDVGAIAEVVKRDASFTAQLLLLSNRDLEECDRFYRIEDCIVQLGISTLQELVWATPALAASDWRCGLLLNHSHMTAAAAEAIALQTPGVDPDKVYVAGLLHLFPELIMLATAGNPNAITCEPDEWPLPAFIWEAIFWTKHPWEVAEGENLLCEVVRVACESVGMAALQRYRDRRSGLTCS